jgi:hypothetical protein
MTRHAFLVAILVAGMFLTNCSAQRVVSAKPKIDAAKVSYPKGVSTEMLDVVKQNYLKSLRSNSPGVIESAVFYVVKYKLFYPQEDCEEIAEELDRLAANGPEPRIRYKAQIASNFIHNSEWLATIDKVDYKDSDQFFALLAEKLNTKFFAYEN